MVRHIPITQEVEAGGFLRVPGLCGLQSEFKVKLACVAESCLRKRGLVIIVGGGEGWIDNPILHSHSSLGLYLVHICSV